MTTDEQEAGSHKHYCGFWLVPLESGQLAFFDHPNGKLVRITDASTDEGKIAEIFRMKEEVAAAYDAKKTAETQVWTGNFSQNFEGMDLGDLQL